MFDLDVLLVDGCSLDGGGRSRRLGIEPVLFEASPERRQALRIGAGVVVDIIE